MNTSDHFLNGGVVSLSKVRARLGDRPSYPATPPTVAVEIGVEESPSESWASLLAGLAAVGTLTGLYIKQQQGGDYSLTVKLIMSSGERVYRYGFIGDPVEALDLLGRWLEARYWTPDRYPNK